MKALITKNMIRFSREVPKEVQESLGLTGGRDYLDMSEDVSLQQIREVLEFHYILEVRNERDLTSGREGYILQTNSDARTALLTLILQLQSELVSSDIILEANKLNVLNQMVQDYIKSL